MAKLNDDAMEHLQRFLSLKGSRATWEKNAVRDWAFYLNKQYTRAEWKNIQRRGQAPLVINRIFPLVQYIIGLLSQRIPVIKAVPVGDTDSKMASLMTQIISHILYRSDWNGVAKKVLKDCLITGVGYFYAYVDYDELGRPEVMVDALSWKDVYVDPEARRQDIDDASDVIVTTWITKKRAKVLFPDHADRIDELMSEVDESTFAEGTYYGDEEIQMFNEVIDPESDKVRYMERYEKIIAPVMLVTVIGNAGDTAQFEFDQEQWEKFKERNQQIVNDENVIVTEAKVPRIKVTRLLSDVVVSEDILPLRRYPIIPVYYEHVENPYPVGIVRFLRGIQKEINKRRTLMIAHATASTGVRLLAPRGVFDVDEIEAKLSQPVAIIEYTPHPQAQLQPLVPPALPNEFYRLEAEAKQDFEYAGGVTSFMQGFAQFAPETRGATLALIEAGRTRMYNILGNLYSALVNLGRVIVDLVQHEYDEARILRLVNPIDLSVMEQPVNVPADDYTGAVRRINDLTVGKYDVFVLPSSIGPNNRAAEQAMMLELYSMGIVDREEVIKKLDIVDKEGLMKRMGTIEQLMELIRMQQEYISKLESDKESLENLALREKVNRKAAQVVAQLERDRANLSAKMRLATDRYMDVVKQQMEKKEGV